MNQPSEESRYLASWLTLHEDEWLKYEPGFNDCKAIYEGKLAECIQSYFDSRQ